VKNTQKGRKNEEIAARFLQEKGYIILERNWRSGKKEIDIISEKDDYLVVAEVKSGLQSFLLRPEESVSRKKQKMIVEAAEAYIIKNEISKEVRFDVIFVTGDTSSVNIEHIPDAFYPIL
jgi:putative endonuclease